MKNIARLVLFFSLSFIISLLIISMVLFLETWNTGASAVPGTAVPFLQAMLKALQSAMSASLYFSLLFSLSYSVRRKMSAPMSMILLFVLALALTLGINAGLRQGRNLPDGASRPAPAALGKPGLIVSRGDTAIVVLGNPAEQRSPRLVSIPGRPLIYQEVPLGPDNTVLALPPLSFGYKAPYYLRSLMIDFRLSAENIYRLFGEGFPEFLIYVSALTLLLISLRFIFGLSRWPLANLFFGALIFRMVLSLEILINRREIRGFLMSFTGDLVPQELLPPLVLCAMALLVLLYTLLAGLARGRRAEDE
ncbi:hypothetical protein LJC14_02740 [Treponema sp. OttesenSCG-928-L16]|nr:hypothetical protein [Treponema sp. OttesenSCG-928-L16]